MLVGPPAFPEVPLVRLVFHVTVAAAVALVTVSPSMTRADARSSMEIIIGDGPHAGTYNLPEEGVGCTRWKKSDQLSALYADPEEAAALMRSIISGKRSAPVPPPARSRSAG